MKWPRMNLDPSLRTEPRSLCLPSPGCAAVAAVPQGRDLCASLSRLKCWRSLGGQEMEWAALAAPAPASWIQYPWGTLQAPRASVPLLRTGSQLCPGTDPGALGHQRFGAAPEPRQCLQGWRLPWARAGNPCLFPGGNARAGAAGRRGPWKGTRAKGRELRGKQRLPRELSQRQPGQGRGWES